MKKNDMSYIHDLLTKLDLRLDDIHEVQVRHDENLKEHMRRSLANEQAVEALKQELTPVKKHIHMVQGVGAFIGLIAVIASIYAAVK